jgi:mono/diheme cytochrome c family protein
MCPGILGGVEWSGPAYDRSHHAVLVGAVDWCSTITPKKDFQFKPGNFNMAGSFKFDDQSRGWSYAVDADSGEPRWKFEAPAPQVSGITPTAGGVVYAGDMAGNFVTLDSSSGKVLHEADTGGALAGGVITYMQGGKQYVAFTAGNLSRLTFGVVRSPTLRIYGPGGKQPVAAATATATGAATEAAPDLAASASLYGKVCASCHGTQGEGAVGPALKGLAQRTDLARTVQWIKNPSAKMPKLYPAPLDAGAVRNVAAYVQKLD